MKINLINYNLKQSDKKNFLGVVQLKFKMNSNLMIKLKSGKLISLKFLKEELKINLINHNLKQSDKKNSLRILSINLVKLGRTTIISRLTIYSYLTFNQLYPKITIKIIDSI